MNMAHSVNILLFIPESECDVLQAVGIRDTSDAVFAPPESTRPGMIMGEVYKRMGFQYFPRESV